MKETINQPVTGLILTWNEKENIFRTLSKLTWLEKIIIIDSGSNDGTINIIKSFLNTEIYYRQFDSFAEQCNYGLSVIDTPWVLSLDADYIVTEVLSAEIRLLLKFPQTNAVAYAASFNFLVFGKSLRANNTTPRPVLFKKELCSYYNDGHAHRLQVNGNVARFKYKINHDDRKSLSRWLASQDKYAVQESEKLSTNKYNNLSLTAKLRKTKLAPVLILFYCLFVKGLIFKGWRGWHYTLQRTIAEMLISLRLTEAQHGDNGK